MTKTFLIALAGLAAAATTAHAQAPAGAPPAPPPPRARGPMVDVATMLAQTAIATCLGNGYKVTALVVDSAGVPVVLMSGNGAAARTQEIGATKAAAVIKYKMSSGDLADKVKTDTALDAAVKADPKIGVARRGALPLMAGGDMIGAFAVSGAPGGDKDEACVSAALAKYGSQLK